jgi:hypothetical protein
MFQLTKRHTRIGLVASPKVPGNVELRLSSNQMKTTLFLWIIIAVAMLIVRLLFFVRVRRLQAKGLYPKRGEPITESQIDNLLQCGERIAAISLTRHLYRIGLRDAVLRVDQKQRKGSSGPQIKD